MPFFRKKKSKEGLNEDSIVYSMTPRHGHGQDVVDENGIRQVAGCLPIDPINKRFLLVTSASNPGSWVIVSLHIYKSILKKKSLIIFYIA